MKAHKKYFGVVLCVLAACAVLAGCSEDAPKRKAVIRPVVAIRVPDPEASRTRAFPGTARAAIESRLSFRVGGEIIKLPAKVGMKVRPGDLVARLDPTDYRLKLGRAEAATAEAAAALAQARSDWERTRALYEVGNASRRDLDRARAQFDASAAQYRSIKNMRKLASQQLKYTELRAPVAGALAEVPVEVHQTVGAGQPIATLTAGSRLQMQTGVPDTLIAKVKTGQPVKVRFDALPAELFAGEVIEVGVETGTVSTFPVKVALKEQDGRIRAGMSGDVMFSFAAQGDPVLVPAAASFSGADHVLRMWVVNEADKTVSSRKVRLGRLSAQGVEVLEGLHPGDILVIRGVHSIQEGQKVNIELRSAEVRP